MLPPPLPVAQCVGQSARAQDANLQYAPSLDGFELQVTIGSDPESYGDNYLTTALEVETRDAAMAAADGAWTPYGVTECPGACMIGDRPGFRVDVRAAALTPGSDVRVRVQTINKPGLSSSSDWLTIRLDDTPPLLPADMHPNTAGGQPSPNGDGMVGVSNGFVDYFQPTRDAVSLNWTAPGFVDLDSSVRTIVWELCTVARDDPTDKACPAIQEEYVPFHITSLFEPSSLSSP